MGHIHSAFSRRHQSNEPRLVRVGPELYPVWGDDEHGWCVESNLVARFRYRSLDELLFALVNLSLAEGGSA